MHETRVAARRLRSTLRVCGEVVHAASAYELNNELAWHADLLGEVRDREVLSARLTMLVAGLPQSKFGDRTARTFGLSFLSSTLLNQEFLDPLVT